MLRNQIEGSVVPMIRNMFSDLKQTKGKDFRDGLNRILHWDSKETERVTIQIVLTKIPQFFYWIESLLTLRMRRLYQSYGKHENCDGMDRCVFVDPYLFIGLLFQTIAKQLLLQPSEKNLTLIEFQTLVCRCLQNFLSSTFPFEPDDDWQGTIEKQHQMFWSRYPHVRQYIQYRNRWIENLKRPVILPAAAPSSPSSSAELQELLLKGLSGMKEQFSLLMEQSSRQQSALCSSISQQSTKQASLLSQQTERLIDALSKLSATEGTYDKNEQKEKRSKNPPIAAAPHPPPPPPPSPPPLNTSDFYSTTKKEQKHPRSPSNRPRRPLPREKEQEKDEIDADQDDNDDDSDDENSE